MEGMKLEPNNLYLGDCLELMAGIPDGSVDMVLCDLPYGTTACKWDSVIPFEPLWAQYKRVTRPGAAIVLHGSQPFTSTLVTSNIDWFRYDWSWDKANPSGHLNAKLMPLRRHEDILVFGKGRLTYNPQMRTGKFRKRGGGYRGKTSDCYGKQTITESWGDQYYPTSVIAISNANRATKVHPTEKPLELAEYLIRTYTNEGEVVLDNTMGSGTTCLAARNTGRRFIGIEKDEGYYKVACGRLGLPVPPTITPI